MELCDSAEEASFRRQIRDFVGEHLPRPRSLYEVMADSYADADASDAGGFVQRWRQALAERNWLAPHWPKEYGGGGLTPIEQFIFNEEMANVRAPSFAGAGLMMIGPTLVLYGTAEQKQQHLPGITSGEVKWAQGYSEPGSGSDLASLQTRAVRDGDDYVINGQKIWSSGAHEADWMFMLARTDPDAPKHRGISMLLLSMKTPGVSVRPLVNMAGEHHFNETFFDNVRVPASNRVGEENRGWYIGATLLDFERSNIARVIALRHTVGDLLAFAHEHPEGQMRDSRTVRLELAERAIEAEIGRMFSYRIVTLQKRGQVPNYEASMSKAWRSETQQRIAQTGMKLIGLYGNAWDDGRWSPLRGYISRMYVETMSATIAGGTSEIQRNVIATRGLGLPRG